jgi:tetratricopeptide (TPR) repeat protein
MRPDMKIQALLVAAILALAGCAGTEVKKDTQAADSARQAAEYVTRARDQESRGELLEALESYKLALTVDPANAAAAAQRAEVERRLNGLAEENYKAGLELQRLGKYGQARQKFLTAVRYRPDYPEAVESLKAERLDAQKVKLHLLYTMKPGEMLANVAERYYRDYQKHYLIGAFNEVEDSAKIGAGQTIRVPVVEGVACFVTPAEAQLLAKQRPGALPPEVVVVKGVATHTVKAGDSLPQLSQTYYGARDRAALIAAYNAIRDGAALRPGRKLLIPQVEGTGFRGVVADEAPQAESSPAAAEARPPAEAKLELAPEPVRESQPAAAAVPAAPPVTVPVDPAAEYRRQGQEFLKAGNHAGAIAEFRKVLNVSPQDPVALKGISQAHFDLGVKSFEQKAYQPAVENFKAALGYQPGCERCADYIRRSEEFSKEQHYAQGLSYFQSEKLVEAIREWEIVSAMDPGYKDVARNLQKARTLQERLDAIRRSKPQ